MNSPPEVQRTQCVASQLRERSVDALLVTHPVNLRYLTGFTGTNGLALVAAGGDGAPGEGQEAGRSAEGRAGHLFLTDFRYDTQSAAQVPALFERRIVPVDLLEAAAGELAPTEAGRHRPAAGIPFRPARMGRGRPVRHPACRRPPRLRRGHPHGQAAPAPARAPARALGARPQRRPGRGAARGQGAARDRAHPRCRGARRRGVARRPGSGARRTHRAGGRDRARATYAPPRRHRPELPLDRRRRPPLCPAPRRATRRADPARHARHDRLGRPPRWLLLGLHPHLRHRRAPLRRGACCLRARARRPASRPRRRARRDRTAKRSTP